MYKRNFGTDLDKATNELVLRVQPDEAIYLKINNKVPGLGMRLDRSDLNLLYRARYWDNQLFYKLKMLCQCWQKKKYMLCQFIDLNLTDMLSVSSLSLMSNWNVLSIKTIFAPIYLALVAS